MGVLGGSRQGPWGSGRFREGPKGVYIVGRGMVTHGMRKISVLGGRIVSSPLKIAVEKWSKHGLISKNRLRAGEEGEFGERIKGCRRKEIKL